MYGAPISCNLGGASVTTSIVMALRKHFPDVEFVLSPQSPERNFSQANYYIKELKISETRVSIWKDKETLLGFVIVLCWAILNKLKIFNFTLNNSDNFLVRNIYEANIVMDIRGISQTDFFSKVRTHINENLVLYTAWLMNKPTVKFTQDMGPFLKFWNRVTAKFFLKKYDLIYARGIITKELLNEIGVSENVIVSPDTAFILKPSERFSDGIEKEETQMYIDQCIAGGKPIIGVTISRQVDYRSRRSNEKEGESSYIKHSIDLLRHALKTTSANILLLPNEFALKDDAYDDLFIAKKIHKELNQSERCFLLKKSPLAQDLKKIIKQCDVIIASRYHAIVASLSMCRPTLVIGWGFKYDQLLELVGQRRYLVNHDNIDKEILFKRFDELWKIREEIETELVMLVSKVKQTIYENTGLLRKFD